MADDTPKEEKTEEATPRKLDEAREKGQVALSQELIAALMLIGAGVSLAIGGPALLEATGSVAAGTAASLDDLALNSFDHEDAAAIITAQIQAVAWPLALVIMPMLAIGALAGYGQIGFRIAGKALELDLSKLDPLKGAKKVFGARGVMRLIQAVLKLGAIATTLIAAVYLQMPRLFRIAGAELGPVLRGGVSIVLIAAAAALAVVLLISLIDLIYQRFQHSKDQRMSKEDVKRERKQDEGDPHLKARVRQIQREMATGRMMQDVPDATVVVTNPTHFAVALYYEPDEHGQLPPAPLIVAKGMDDVAQRIKAVAAEAGVPLYEDVPLARGLYAQAEIGEIVPAPLYQAVAAVIQYVWRLKGLRQMPEPVNA